MGDRYGDARLELLYDLDVQANIVNPSNKEKNLGINSIAYFTIPRTNIIVPQGIFIDSDGEPCDNIEIEPRFNIDIISGLGVYKEVIKPIAPVSGLKEGEIYPATLVKRILQIYEELETKRHFPVTDSENKIIFLSGELEKLIKREKFWFSFQFKRAGIEFDSSKLYFRLIADNHFL